MDPSLRLRAETSGTSDQAGGSPDGVLGSLDTAYGWLNSAPLTAAELSGRVVVVNFWTYTCINWLRTLPYVRQWAERYRGHGLVVAGVHTPEFDFERDIGNVRRAVADLGVHHPVVTDNDYAIWDAFANRYWPALYVLDGRGEIRHHRFGEGDYDRSEKVIQDLLAEAGEDGLGQEPALAAGRGIEAPADWTSLRSPENYLGYDRTENFVRGEGAIAAPLRLNQWTVAGDWTVRRDAAVLTGAGGRLACHFHARDLHLVMAPPPGAPVRFRMRIDGQPPGAAHGLDVDEHGDGTVTEPRLHQLVRQPGGVTGRTFEITFLDPGLRAYAFTFG
jgi:thiol-disulfide isomerase/thioredoxin